MKTDNISQLRPIAEAEEVPEGCQRLFWNEDQGFSENDFKQDTHFADIRLPDEPAEKPDPYAELKKAHAEGKVIQYNYGSDASPAWKDIDDPEFGDGSECYRIKPELKTFEAHGKTWTKHTPGDAMPCAREAIIQCLFADGNVWYADAPAQQFRWSKLDSIADIIGWRYADKPLVMSPEWNPQVGDVVRLKSGGPLMTTRGIDKDDPSDSWCHWFDGNRSCLELFPTACLKPSTKEDAR